MTELKDKPIEYYQMKEPSDPIILHKGRMILDLMWIASDVEVKEDPSEPFKTTKEHRHQIISDEGILKLEWHPTLAIKFEIPYKEEPSLIIPGYNKCILSVPDLDLHEEGFAHIVWLEDRWKLPPEPRFAMQKGFLRKKDIAVGTSPDRLNEVRFHIVNFRKWVSKWKYGGTEGRDIIEEHTKIDWIDTGWNIRVKDWDLDLRPAQNCDELVDNMGETGGFAITHIGLLKRQDGKEFSSEQAGKVLDALYYLFSFIRGRWCGIVIPRGFSQGMLVWERWDVTKPISIWGYVNNWAASLSAVIDDEFIQRFINKWITPEWQRDLKPILNYYIEACLYAGGIDGSIAMTQFGLERLTWLELREMGFSDLVTRDRYDGIPASNKLRWLLTSEKIPEDLGDLTNLSEYAKERKLNPLDGPQAITYIRNNIVHPEKEETIIPPPEVMHETFLLSLWYLEMSILHHLGYSGECFDRRSGRTCKVPWFTDS